MAGSSGLVLRRALTQKLVVLSAFGTILLATTILSALILYATSVTDDGIRRTLSTATIEDVGTRITAGIDTPAEFDALDRAARGSTEQAYAHAPTEIVTAVRSEQYTMPGHADEPDPTFIAFGTYDRIEEHTKLTTGRWPERSAAADAPVEAAIPAAAAAAADLTRGQTITVRNPSDGSSVDVVITGVFEATNRDDPYWRVDELALNGVQQIAFTTYGPLLVPPETFFARFTPDAQVAWQVIPDLGAASRQQVDNLTRALTVYRAELGPEPVVATNIATLARDLDRAALVARSTMLIPVLQLVVLAGYALFLTARLIADHRRSEIALLTARGADRGQLAALTLREGLMLGIPAAVAAPLLAAPLLWLVSASPTVRASGLTITDALRPASWLAAAGAAGACALAIAIPAVRSATKTYVENQQARGRGERRSELQRAGGDIAVIAIAILGFLQLRHYGGPITATAEQAQTGGIGIDPFIVTGPAIGLFAAGILAMRLVPVLAGAVERITARRSGLAPALGAWQVARRPLRYAGPALLLVLAVAVGVLSVGTSATWRRSQADQANHQAGADLRITPRTGTDQMGPLGQGGRYLGLPGVTTLSPALRLEGRGSAADPVPIELVALDTTKAADLLHLRPDLMPAGGLQHLTDVLAAGRPVIAGAELPGEPADLAIDVTIALASGNPPSQSTATFVQLRDGAGATHTVAMGSVPADGKRHALVADLAKLAGAEGRIAYPLTVEGLAFTYGLPPTASPASELPLRHVTIGSIAGLDSTGTGVGVAQTLPDGSRWEGSTTATAPFKAPEQPIAESDHGTFLHATLPTFAVGHRAFFLLTSAAEPPLIPGVATDGRPPIDGVVTTDLLAATGTSVGDTITPTAFGAGHPIHIVGVIESLPTLQAGHRGILVDFDSWSTAQYVTTGTRPSVTEWWASTAGHDSDPAAAVLTANPVLADDVVDRDGRTRELLDDPLGGGLQGALYVGFMAAFAFAAIGFAVNAAVSARERITEFALMRAMGVSSRQVFGVLAVEQALLVVLGVVGGVALGALVTWYVVPHIVLTAQATQVDPPVLISMPWAQVLALAATVVAVLGVIVAVLARSLRRSGLGTALRIGEDR